jgi:hypothetical protein
MKATTRILFFLLLVAGVAAVTVFLVAADNDKPFLPGVTVKDDHPNGCVDCHTASGSNDYRLNAELAGVEGHPKIDAIVKNVPQDCLMCHKEGANAGPLSFIVHRDHYRNPADNAFVSHYQGACLNCHSVSPGSGKMSVKNGPKNW